MRRAAVVLGAAALVLAGAGCQTPRGDIPAGYVSMPAQGDVVLAAVSSAGNRLTVKEHPNPPEGTLGFWRDAVRNELVEGRGYELLESSAVEGRGGVPAREFLFRVTRPEGAYLYLVTLRVEGSRVLVAEAGGREASLDAELPSLRAVMR